MLKRKKKVIAKVMATTMLATTIATTFGIEAKADSISPRTAVSSSKISGSDRYKTAVEISKNYSSSSKHAVIVNGQKGIVDALTATPYASLKNAPILMTQNNKLNADTKAELTRRGIKTVDIVGGVNSVNDSVKSEIQAMGITVNRIAGSSKYDTALEVAKKIDAISDISKIAVANGEVLADAVSVAAPAAQNEMPIILAHPKNGLDDKTKSYIDNQGVKTSYVIGGTNSVSSTTQNSLPGTKKRLEGEGRQDTNAAVVEEFYTSSSYDNVYVTKSGQVNTQDEIADALAVGVLAAKEQDPVMIVGKSLATSQSNLLKDKKFTQMTEIGNGIPSASINSIKDTQKSPEELEATVSSVSLVNYNTIKIAGKELKRIDGDKIEINENSVSSYTVNEAGTEAKVVFNKTFKSGTNTVKITSNTGKTTNHSFTYSTGISSVEASTSEIGLDGIQYLEFTVNNGQKRTVKELEDLGWTVEFNSNENVFYKYKDDELTSTNTSTTGQLKTTSKFKEDETFYYEVTLKKDGKTYKADKKYVTCKDKSKDVKEIRDCKFILTSSIDDEKEYKVEMKSKTLLIGETLDIPSIEVTNLNGSKNDELTEGYTIQSSNPNVIQVSKNGTLLTAQDNGTSTITIKIGDVKKTYSMTVNEVTDSNKRKPRTYKFEKTSIKMLSKENSEEQNTETVKVTITDKYGDPIPADKDYLKTSDITWTEHVKSSNKTVADTELKAIEGNKKGEYKMTITPNLDQSLTSGSGTVKLQYDGKDMSGSSLSVYVSKESNQTGKLTYKLKETSSVDGVDLDDIDLDLDRYAKQDDNTLELKLEAYRSGGYLDGVIDLNDCTFGTEAYNYVVETSNEDILSKNDIEVNDKGNLQFTLKDDGDTGSVTISLYQYDKDGKTKTKRADIKVKIEDTTPRLKELKFNEIKDITSFTKDEDNDDEYTTDFELEDLFVIKKMSVLTDKKDTTDNDSKIRNVIDSEYINLKGTQINDIKEVSIDFRGGTDHPVIFIDEDENGIFDGKDDLLATIVMECSEDIKTKDETNSYQIKLDEEKDQDGHIVIRVYDGVYEKTKKPFKNLSIRVKVDKIIKPEKSN